MSTTTARPGAAGQPRPSRPSGPSGPPRPSGPSGPSGSAGSTPADDVWRRALHGRPCTAHGFGAGPRLLPAEHWSGRASEADAALLSHCHGPTLDIGCGPGRMSEHLALGGTGVLGIDVVPEAVRLTRARGVGALVRNVFDPLPAEGRWCTALLADGNIGIGGDPLRLLRRVAELLAPGGRVVLDLAGPGTGLRTLTVTLECDGLVSEPFAWTLVGPRAVAGLALRVGLEVEQLGSRLGRWYAVLVDGR